MTVNRGFSLQHQTDEVFLFGSDFVGPLWLWYVAVLGAVFDVLMFCKRMTSFTTEQNADHQIKLLKNQQLHANSMPNIVFICSFPNVVTCLITFQNCTTRCLRKGKREAFKH